LPSVDSHAKVGGTPARKRLVPVDGPRSDSRSRLIQSLFDEIEIGLRFVRSARKFTDQALRARTLCFAQQSQNVARRLMRSAPLTGNERTRLKQGLFDLQTAIDDCLDAVIE
jgi:hypothetical protein